MHVRYVGWKETIAESHFEDNRSADIIDLFNSLKMLTVIYPGLD
jgi:hypothetical protein